jgi:hypothetical protein
LRVGSALAGGAVALAALAVAVLTDGRWATDYYVATHSKTTYTPPMPRC